MPRAQKDFNELCQKFVWRLNITDDMEYFRRLLSISKKKAVKDPAPVTQKDDIQMKFFQKFVKCSFFCAESESAIRFPEFSFNHPLGVT